jgi:RHS repeat-associated protein
MPLLIGGTDGEVLGMQSGNFGTTRYHSHPIEPTAANVTWRVYYPGGGLRVQTSSSNTLTYLLTDHLNSNTTTLDTDGDITAWLRYDAWGVSRSSSGTTPTDKRYTGQYRAEAGLYFYNARFYDPQLGRFAQADTIIPEPGDPLAWDRYAYVNNNPINGTDPSGHSSLSSSSSLLTPFGFLAFYGSCIQDIKDTYNAYQAGERNLGALYMEATGIEDSVVSLSTDVHQLNQDFSTVFSNAPFIERIGPSVHVGSCFAVGTAATLIGLYQGAKALTRNRYMQKRLANSPAF